MRMKMTATVTPTWKCQVEGPAIQSRRRTTVSTRVKAPSPSQEAVCMSHTNRVDDGEDRASGFFRSRCSACGWAALCALHLLRRDL